jgi:glutathione synthase/RimK-type ligase-like ATP-grasp enzyme
MSNFKNIKKVGVLHGMERSFPNAIVESINKLKTRAVAELVTLDDVTQGMASDYAVIFDRISHDVPYYRATMKMLALGGTAVLNNPFWWSADEKFFNNGIAMRVGVPVPNTALLPSKDRPDNTSETSFSNLKYPLSWEKIFDYVGFPAFMKPFDGGGWRDVYKVHDREDLFDKYEKTHQLVMLLQENINYEAYFRCYCIGGDMVRIMQYEPANPADQRYVLDGGPIEKKMLETIHKYVLKLNNALGYDFNTVEFAVRDGIPYAIDFCNPAPDCDLKSVGQENFDWVINAATELALRKVREHKKDSINLTWGSFLSEGVKGRLLK